jgi:multidrug efflux pump subunit AcrA (membrane-fusion protein)
MRFVAVLCLISVACHTPPAAPPPIDPPALEASSRSPWVKARKPDGVSLLQAPARVLPAPDSVAVVTPPLRARLVRVRATPGQRVARGAALVDVVIPELVGAAGAWLAAGERLQAWQARRAQLESVRGQGLIKLSDIVEADTQVSEAKAAQRLAQASLRAGGASEADAAKLIEDGGALQLKAPIAGTVVAVTGAIGEVREPTADPVVRIVADAAGQVEARFARAPLRQASYDFVIGDVRRALTLVGAAPDVDASDGSTRAWFQLTPGPALPPGMAGHVEGHLVEKDDAFVVPAPGVRITGENAFITVREGKDVRSVPVDVLATSGTDALVRARDGRLSQEIEVAAESVEDGS